jgi:solute carrier family 35 (UDP-sugar transporter), member A1/2/3
MKILTTAAFSVLLLRKKLSSNQWLSLLFLAIGVGVVQIQGGADSQALSARASTALLEMNAMKGFLAVVAACFTSGLAGVYFEMVLKNSQTDLWIRNVQLSLFSLLPALAPIIFTQNTSGYDDTGKGFISSLFNNFGAWAWATVFVQVLGGLVTAMVIKYSDNILKGFATSLSIVISFLASVALFDFKITITFVLGSVIVLIATWLYNQHSSLANIVILKEPWPWMKPENSKEDISLRAPPSSIPQFGAVVSSTSSLVSLSSLSGGTPAMSDSESRSFIR